MQNSLNPLSKHFRQPKLYVRLPSSGNFYPNGSIEVPENLEFPVYAMTAKDELRFKTPDALLNGQSTVDVIQSCMPNIKNAWDVPSIDVDAILIAIRIATYGERMEISTTIPGINEERKYDVDLRTLLDGLVASEYNNLISIGDFKIELKPLSYRMFTESALKTFEERRIIKILDDEEMGELEKIQKFNESFQRLTELNVNLAVRSVVSVKYADEAPVTTPVYIQEFFDNADKDIYKAVIEHIENQRKKFVIKPLVARTTPEEIERGAPENFQVPIMFDQSNFFA